jgi:spore coat polysaccharide biosynthesis protein SpsF
VTTSCVIQARTGSRRLPGKVLTDIGGMPSLELQLRRLQGLRVDALVVATTDQPGDDPVADLATRLGVEVVRGPEDDVLARFVVALEAHPADEVIRLTADCPLTDPTLVEAVLGLRRRTNADYASNSIIRTFPDGLDVEVVSATALRAAAGAATDAFEREHVTPFLYRRPHEFRLAALVGEHDYGDVRWTLDTADDLAVLRHLVLRASAPVDAPWTSFLDPTVDGQTCDGVYARPALPGEEELVEGPVDDLSDRAFVLVRDGQVVGWSRVAVASDGWTFLVVPTRDGVDHGELVAAIQRRLDGDPQVVTLRPAMLRT